MTAHAERVGVLALLGLLMLVGWSAIALGMAADSGAHVSRTMGGVVSKRDGATTIVIGGPFASAAIVVPNEEPSIGTGYAAAVYADGTSDAVPDYVPDEIVTGQLPAVFGSVSLSDTSGLVEAADLIDSSALPDESDFLMDTAAFDGAAFESAVFDGAGSDDAGFDGPSPFEGAVVMEADQILADSAALEELWRLPAVTAEQRQTVGKQV